MVDYWPGILAQGEIERNLGDFFQSQIPLRISHLPTDIHKCEELILINTFVWGTTMPVLLFDSTLLVTFIFRSGIWHYPVLPGAFPGGSDDKESACNTGGPRFDARIGKIPWRKDTPVFLPGKSHGQRSLAGYSPWGCRELDTTKRLTLPLSILHQIFNELIILHKCLTETTVD